jgi:PhnB protein
MQISSYLSFSGNCEEAFKFYEGCLGGKITAMVPHEGTPAAAQVPPDWRMKILHARLLVGEGILMGADVPPDRYHAPKGFSVTLGPDTPAEAERIFQALAINATVRMPIQKTFFAARFGMLTDQYGIPWMIICEQGA